ncbi:MAG: hypothetical protein MUF84_07550 [Anaerolineae bacterium]|nr:hypothetical protein [Anaerolineae bacterium]
MASSDTSFAERLGRWAIFLLLIAFLMLIIANAWLSDDAYITFRTVDNFIHGYGLTWNVPERVQTYTHPLWMLLLSGFYAVTREIYFTSILLSIAVSFAAAAVLALCVARGRMVAAVAVVAVCLSKAYIDYSTSGLENPLTHLILVGFIWAYTAEPLSTRRFLLLSTLAALGMVNRLDTGLLMLPALMYAYWEVRSRRSLMAGMLGLMPLVAWELFALFYYGSPVPNTALAKLNSGLIPSSDLYREGVIYLLNSFRVDPITLVAVGMGVLLPVVLRDWRKTPLALGVVLYVLYVVRVGGDFMSGRFLTAPFLQAVALVSLARRWPHRVPPWLPRLALLLMFVALGVSAPYSPIRSQGSERADADARVWVRGRMTTDERANYYANTGLLVALQRDMILPNHDWAAEGLQARESGSTVAIRGSVGFFGFFAGPDVHVVDLLGLGDPLLARLPVTDPDWQIGHFGRRPPEGYLDSLSSGGNHIVDPNLAIYYGKLSSVIRGDLWARDRLREIWYLNTGAYDRYLDGYAYYRGTTLTQNLVITNPTQRPYVYAYVWNNGAGETYLLDTASSQGQVYSVRWEVSAMGAAFDGPHVTQIAKIGELSDTEPLATGVLFSDDSTLSTYEAYERRFWFTLNQPDGNAITVVFPALEWYNSEAPDGFWREVDIDAVLAPSTR